MESLYLAFTRVIEAGVFIGIRIDSSLMISHLFYADDAVFIGEWSQDNLKGIIHILRCFSLLSGLSINVKKSHLLDIGVLSSCAKSAAESLGCSVMTTPFNYLGIKVGGNMSLVKSWGDMVDKLKKRLSKWKLKSLSIGGRLTLLKSFPRLFLIIWKKCAVISSMIRIGNGAHTQFWNEFWLGDSVLKDMFPRLYALENCKDCYVADKLMSSVTSSFRRTVRGGAKAQQLSRLLETPEPVILSNMEDRWVWDMNGDGVF
ncbi:RNA-directed DNA polymerase, eukaryota [Tanacetum coccineum]